MYLQHYRLKNKLILLNICKENIGINQINY